MHPQALRLIAGHFRLSPLQARFDETALVGIARLVRVFIAEVHFNTGNMLTEAVQTGVLTKLLKWLDHDSLDYRVLAIHNLREITGGVSKGYRPEDSSKRRKIDLRKIWDQFESNELLTQP